MKPDPIKYQQILMSRELEYSEDDELSMKNIADGIEERLKRFEEWSKREMVGRKDNTSYAYRSQVQSVITCGVFEQVSLGNVFETLAVTILSQDHRPRTVQNYLKSLQRICSFYIDILSSEENPLGNYQRGQPIKTSSRRRTNPN